MLNQDLRQRVDDYRKDIRRRQLDEVFRRKRLQFVPEQPTSITQAIEFIKEYPKNKLLYPFLQLIQHEDHSLFRYFTGWHTLQSSPFFYLIEQSLRRQSEMQIQLPTEQLPPCQLSELPHILSFIWDHYLNWSIQQSQMYLKTFQTLRRYPHEHELITPMIIQWIGLLISFLSVGQKIRKCLVRFQYPMTKYIKMQRKIVGVEQMQYQSKLFLNGKYLLINILSNDQSDLLIPFLPIINSIIKNDIQFSEVYYNIFLIRGVSCQVKNTLLNDYFILLFQNNEQYLKNHKQYNYVISFAVKNAEPDQQFINICQLYMKLINSILKIINVRYQTRDQDNVIMTICNIINTFIQHKQLRQGLLECKHILRMFLCHLLPISPLTEIILLIYSKLTDYDYIAIHLLTEQPLFMIKFMNILNKHINEYSLNLHLILRIYSNMTLSPLLCHQFLQQQLSQTVLSIHRLYYSQNDSKVKSMLRECYAIVYNVFEHIGSSNDEEEIGRRMQELVSAQMYEFLVCMLKVQTRGIYQKKMVKAVMKIIRFFADAQEIVKGNCKKMLQFMLVDFVKLDYLDYIQEEEVEDTIKIVKDTIKSFKKR